MGCRRSRKLKQKWNFRSYSVKVAQNTELKCRNREFSDFKVLLFHISAVLSSILEDLPLLSIIYHPENFPFHSQISFLQTELPLNKQMKWNPEDLKSTLFQTDETRTQRQNLTGGDVERSFCVWQEVTADGGRAGEAKRRAHTVLLWALLSPGLELLPEGSLKFRDG